MAAEAVRTRVDMGDIKNLAPLSKRLNAQTDEFNAAIESIQDKLNALSLGVEAWLDADGQELASVVANVFAERSNDEDEPITRRRTLRCWELGYGRSGEGWAIL